jgi:hypothetical protein
MDFADGMGEVSGRVLTKGSEVGFEMPILQASEGVVEAGGGLEGWRLPLSRPQCSSTPDRAQDARVWGTGCLTCGARSKATLRGSGCWGG